MAKAKETIDIEVLSPEVEEIIDKEIETSLVKQNVTETLLARLEQEYGDLKIKGPDDKEGYMVVQSARKDCKSVRVLISKTCKAGRAKANAEAKKWVTKENTLTDRVSLLEDRLEADEKAWEQERDHKKALEAQQLEQQGIERVSHMMGFGARIEGGNWVLGDISYESVLVKSSDPDIYQGIYDQFKAQFDENEKDRLAKEEEQRLKEEKFLKDQEELKRQQQEARETRTEGRVSLLTSLGMGAILSHDQEAFAYGDVRVWLRDVEERDAQDWEVIIIGVKEGVEKVKQAAKEVERVRDISRQRILQLKEWASTGETVYSMDGVWGTVKQLVNLNEEEFSNLLLGNDNIIKDRDQKKQQEREKELENARLEGVGKTRREAMKLYVEDSLLSDLHLGSVPQERWDEDFKTMKIVYEKRQKELSDKAEKERQELLGEKQRWEEMVASFKGVQIPDFKSGQYRAKANTVRGFIDGLK